MTKKNIFSLLIFLALGIFCVYLGLRGFLNDEEAIRQGLDYFYNVTWYHYFILVIILSMAHIARALRWRLLLKSMGHHTSVFNAFAAIMIGYMVNSALPRVGEIVRCSVLQKYNQIPFEKSLGTVLAERVIDVLCLFIIIVLSFFLEPTIIQNAWFKIQAQSTKLNPSENNTYLFTYLTIAVLIIIGFVIFYFRQKLKNIILKLRHFLIGLKNGFLSVYYLKNKLLFFFYTLVIWVGYIFSLYIGLITIQNFVPTINMVLVCLSLASIGMIVTPGGIGSFGLMIQFVLENYNCPSPIAFANGNLQWAVQLLLGIILGLICLILIPIINKNTIK
ncbi:MAG: lysylphosphatidylglycerol synthase transmembrane domain-containing protein [Alphaproteobacteria bacterium]|nr:lysylphosphatidylglycerol synthase transmembrane domain-containing protein [Alphaproteobacteria bacterium]